jgi:ankyrin repeat protein
MSKILGGLKAPVFLRTNSCLFLTAGWLVSDLSVNLTQDRKTLDKRCRNYAMAMVLFAFFVFLTSCASAPRWSDAAKRGDHKAARSIILETKDISSRNIYGETPLLWAAKIGDLPFVSKLMTLGASVNEVNTITGETPLIAAARHGHVNVVNFLIDSGARRNATDKSGADAVSAAISSAKFEVLQTLLKKGFDIDGNRLGPLLISASNSGEIRIVEHLLQAGASIDYQGPDGETVLMAAVKSGKMELVNSLLKRGAKVGSADSVGRTPLILAAQSGRWETCEALIASGYSVNVKDLRGNTPLIWALLMGHQRVALGLIEKGADVSAKNMANNNALYLAAFVPRTARSLLQRGARIVEVPVENGNWHGSALAYRWLGGFIEKEASEGRSDPEKAAADAKLAYDVAARLFEQAGNQYADMASKWRAKQATEALMAVLLTAASYALASAQAHQMAHQNAEISALRSAASGGSGRGVGYGFSPYIVATPNVAPLAKSAQECDELAAKVRELAKQCKNKVECYNNAGPGQGNLCFQK